MGKSQSKLSEKQISDLQKHTSFDRHELQQRYNLFLKGRPSGGTPGRLDKAGFCRMYQEVTGSRDSGEFAGYLFNAFDENRDGSVDLKEFMCALSLASRGSLEDKVKWAFEIYDIDGSGAISYEELLRIVQSIYKMSGPTDGPSQNEDTPEHWAGKLFDCIDGNKDDEITCDELVEQCKRDPTILQALCTSNSLG